MKEKKIVVNKNLEAMDFDIFVQLALHSSSLKKLIKDIIHSYKSIDKPSNCRSNIRRIITTTNSSTSDVEKTK